MITDELKQFIKDSIARGIPVSTIRTQLIGAGWQSADVEEGLKSVAPAIPAVSPTPIAPTSHTTTSQAKISHTPILGTEKTHSKNHTALWISGIIVLIILAGVGYMYSKGYFLKNQDGFVDPNSIPPVEIDAGLVSDFNATKISFSYPSNWGLREYTKPAMVSLRSQNDFLDEDAFSQPVDHSPVAYGNIVVFYDKSVLGFSSAQIASLPEVVIGKNNLKARKYETLLVEEGGDEAPGSKLIAYFLDNGMVIQYASYQSTEPELDVFNKFLASFALK